MHTYINLFLNLLDFMFLLLLSKERNMEVFVNLTKFNSDDTYIVTTRIFHSLPLFWKNSIALQAKSMDRDHLNNGAHC